MNNNIPESLSFQEESESINTFIINYLNELINNSILKSTPNNPQNEIKSNPKFYEKLLNMMKIQENILNLTGISKAKIINVNIIANEQLKNFRDNYTKNGKYFKLIQTELALIADNMK